MDGPTTLTKTARTTGVAYLALVVTGMLGFLVVRPRIYDAGASAETLANLVAHEGLARWGVALELGIVAAQALVAISFYRLFRPVNPVAAGALAAFGLVNAVVILGSAAMLTGAVEVATTPGLVPDPEATVQVLYAVSGSLWSVGGLFFGLWLVPMGYLAVVSAWMPRVLGWVLVAGGAGYLLSTFVSVLLPGTPDAVLTGLTVPATVGEFWIVVYLLVRGVRRGAVVNGPQVPAAA